jgi:hypothetical protein
VYSKFVLKPAGALTTPIRTPATRLSSNGLNHPSVSENADLIKDVSYQPFHSVILSP